jgi:hypothetical protein
MWSSIFKVADDAWKLHRGLGWVQDVKKASSTWYVFALMRRILPASISTPGDTKPWAFSNSPVLLPRSISSVSPDSRSVPCMNTTLPAATTRRVTFPSAAVVSYMSSWSAWMRDVPACRSTNPSAWKWPWSICSCFSAFRQMSPAAGSHPVRGGGGADATAAAVGGGVGEAEGDGDGGGPLRLPCARAGTAEARATAQRKLESVRIKGSDYHAPLRGP